MNREKEKSIVMKNIWIIRSLGKVTDSIEGFDDWSFEHFAKLTLGEK